MNSLIQYRPQPARGTAPLIRGVMLLLILLKATASYGLETPEYEVLYSEGKIEYRRYAAFIVAETAVESEDSAGKVSREGFMRLFGYITGDNVQKSDIAMTAPVLQSDQSSTKIAMTSPVLESRAEDATLVAFMLPSQYDLASAPQPTNADITLRTVPARLVASISYSGRWTEKNVTKYRRRLEAHLAEASVNTVGNYSTAVYNPPFTPPFMRRNEIHYEISALPTQ